MLQISIPRYSRRVEFFYNEARNYIYNELRKRTQLTFFPASEIQNTSPQVDEYPRFLHEVTDNIFEVAIIHTLVYKDYRNIALLGALTGAENYLKEVTIPLDCLPFHDMLHLADYISTYCNYEEMVKRRKAYTLEEAQNAALAILDNEPDEDEQYINIYEYSEDVCIIEMLMNKHTDTEPKFVVISDWMQPELGSLRHAEEVAFEMYAEKLVEDFHPHSA